MYVNKKTNAHAPEPYYTQNEISEKIFTIYFEAANKEHKSKISFRLSKDDIRMQMLLHRLNKLNNSISIIVGNSNPEKFFGSQ